MHERDMQQSCKYNMICAALHEHCNGKFCHCALLIAPMGDCRYSRSPRAAKAKAIMRLRSFEVWLAPEMLVAMHTSGRVFHALHDSYTDTQDSIPVCRQKETPSKAHLL